MIQQFLKEHNLNQLQLAALLETPPQTVRNWIHERRTPPAYLRRALNDIARELEAQKK